MNDERPIEKLLRRAAQKRSDEAAAPPELHPVNRRLLLDEAAKQFPPSPVATPSAATPPPQWLQWWTLLKQRWVYGVGVFAVIWIVALAIVPMLSKPKSQELAASTPEKQKLGFDLAKDSAAAPEALAVPAAAPVVMETDAALAINSATEPARTLAPQPATRSAALRPSSTEARRELNARYQNSSAQFTNALVVADAIASRPRADQFARAGSAVPSPATEAVALSKASQLTVSDEKQRGTLAATTSALTELAAAAPAEAEARADGYFADKNFIARGGGLEREPLTRASQRFANTTALAPKKESRSFGLPVAVLQNFRVEQAGRDMRIVDGDGSVYTGVVDEDNTRYKQIVNRQNATLSNAYESKFKFQAPKTAPAIAGKIAEAQVYSYRVEGTNRTLNQNVVFSWNFVNTNTLAADNLNYRAAAQKLDALNQPTSFPVLLQNSYINGRAQLGVSREIEVNALPVKP